MLRSIINRFICVIRRRNSVSNNFSKWDNYDWSEGGEEWSNDPEWKQAFVDYVLIPNVPEGVHILEIGPGAGRWSEYLAKLASQLDIVDLSPQCIKICKKKFKNHSNINYFINDGSSLGFLPDSSIDFIWSWDVFVHIDSKDIRKYINEFARVLTPGGKALIHHSKNGANMMGWRSNMTAKKMVKYCNETGLNLNKQFDTWGGGRFRIWPTLAAEQGPDIVSVLSKPLSST